MSHHGDADKMLPQGDEMQGVVYNGETPSKDIKSQLRQCFDSLRDINTHDQSQSTPNSIPKISEALSIFRSAFSSWTNRTEGFAEIPNIMVYVLEHIYADASLSLGTLRGKDLNLASHLEEILGKEDVYFCLANVKQTMGGRLKRQCDDDRGLWFYTVEDAEKKETSLEYLASARMDGFKITCRSLFKGPDLFKYFLQDDAFHDSVLGQISATADAASELTYFHNRSVVLLMPRSYRANFILNHFVSFQEMGWLHSLKNDLNAESERAERATKEIEEVCAEVIQRTKDWNTHQSGLRPYSNEVLAWVCTAAADIKDTALFMEAFTACINKVHLDLFDFVAPELPESLPRLSSLLAKIPSLTNRWAIIRKLVRAVVTDPDCEQSKKDSTKLWGRMESFKLVAEVELNSEDDGTEMCKVLQVYGASIVDLVVTAVRDNIASTSMVFAFLDGLMKAEITGKIHESLTRQAMKDLLPGFINNLDLKIIFPSGGSNRVYSTPLQLNVGTAREKIYLDLMHHCHAPNLRQELDQLVAKVYAEVTRTEPRDLASNLVFISFAQHLIKEFRNQNESIFLNLLPLKGLFQHVVKIFHDRYVGPNPADDFRREPVVCRARGADRACTFCTQINAFLQSRTRETVTLTGASAQQQEHALEILVDVPHCIGLSLLSSGKLHIRKIQDEEAIKAWQERQNEAMCQLKKLGTAMGFKMLQQVLDASDEYIKNLQTAKRVKPTEEGDKLSGQT